jgi:hypothetical protein
LTEQLYGFKDGQRLSRHLGILQLKRAADAGQADAQYEYRRCLGESFRCKADCMTGAEYLRPPAEQGGAVEAFRLSVEQGDAERQLNFG